MKDAEVELDLEVKNIWSLEDQKNSSLLGE